MKKFLAFFLAFLLVPSVYPAVQNIKVSGDVIANAVVRDLSLGGKGGNLDAEDFLGSQIRLRFDADLSENVSAVIRLINERLWGEETVYDSDIDLDLGYVVLKEFMYQPLTLIIGRQELRLGNGLILGDPDTNQGANEDITPFEDLSLRKAFDAINAILDFSPFTLNLIFALGDEGSTNVNDDVNVFGVNLGYQWGNYNGLTELYFLGSNKAPGVTTQDNESRVYNLGLRNQMDLNDNLSLGLEGAYQFGDTTAQAGKVRAFALQAMGTYKFLDQNNSQIGLMYTYLSGDKDTTDNKYTAWNPMFEDQTPGEIINALFSHSNVHNVILKASTMPREDLTLGILYSWARLAKDYSLTSYTPANGPAASNTYRVDKSKKNLGNEIDVYAAYDYTEDVQLKLTGAWFIPGSFFVDSNDETAYVAKAGIKVSF